MLNYEINQTAISVINRLIAITEPMDFYCGLMNIWQVKLTFWQEEYEFPF